MGREAIERNLRCEVIVDKFPGGAGAVLPHIGTAGYAQDFGKSPENPYAPFQSEMEWRIATWAKLRGPSSTACSELLNIPNLKESLGLSFKNSRELNRIIDNDLPNTRP